MTKPRRIVTAHDEGGRAFIASDEELSFVEMAGMKNWGWLDIWSTDRMKFPDTGIRPQVDWMFPPIGGMRYGHCTIPPRANSAYDTNTSGSPGDLRNSMSDKGMHRSATLDVIFIVKGSCICELDDGVQVQLNAGDSLIQNGTIHAWSNPFDAECQLSSVMIGATNDLIGSSK